MQFANPFSRVDPEILVVENAEILATTDQQVIAVRMEGRNLQPRDISAAEFVSHSFPHFAGSVVGVGDSKNLFRPGLTFLNEPRNSSGENSSLARTSARHHQHRTEDMLDGFLLAGIGFKR